MTHSPVDPAVAWDVQHRVTRFFHDIDARGGSGIAEFYAEYGRFHVGGRTYQGRPEIRKFYVDRAEHIRQTLKDGERVSRHLVMNFMIADRSGESITVEFKLLYFSGEGRPPLLGRCQPAVVADCLMELQADTGLILEFRSTPVFLGDDPFLRAAVGPGTEEGA